MSLILMAGVIVGLSGICSLFFRRLPTWASAVGAGGVVVGCGIGLIPTVLTLLNGSTESFRIPWNIPYGSFSIELDPLSALFLLPILGLSAIAAVYGTEYLVSFHSKKSVAASWFFFNVLVVNMLVVVLARNAVLFLISWEGMSLASFFLVTFEDEKKNVRQAGWTYLVAAHLGTACLLALFILLSRQTSTLDFGLLGNQKALTSETAGLLFLLAVIGFGTKAGFMPFHVWLPEAHPAAPSHVSAVMSGVMIKTGIYGLVRTLSFFPQPPLWWGLTLVMIGVTSGVQGVLWALAQHELKRLLAYSSIENIGIIMMGLGIGVIGITFHSPTLAVLGLCGALFHVINHALFKGLLFLCAGSVLHSTGVLEIDHLGGLLKKMRWTGTTFLVGAVAISGLPPLNGFISEFLIYLGAAKGVISFQGPAVISALAVLVALTLIGGLATACFTKAFGIVFLGRPRSEEAAHAHEGGPAMRFGMTFIAVTCVLVAVTAPFMIPHLFGRAIESITKFHQWEIESPLANAVKVIPLIVTVFLAFVSLVLILAALRKWLLSSRPVAHSVTWDCGYSRPSARMQYTASSYAQPLTSLFRTILRTKRKYFPPSGFFPRHSALFTVTPDFFSENLFQPVYRGIQTSLSKWRWLQHGRLQIYVLYIGLTLLILLLWNLR